MKDSNRKVSSPLWLSTFPDHGFCQAVVERCHFPMHLDDLCVSFSGQVVEHHREKLSIPTSIEELLDPLSMALNASLEPSKLPI